MTGTFVVLFATTWDRGDSPSTFNLHQRKLGYKKWLKRLRPRKCNTQEKKRECQAKGAAMRRVHIQLPTSIVRGLEMMWLYAWLSLGIGDDLI